MIKPPNHRRAHKRPRSLLLTAMALVGAAWAISMSLPDTASAQPAGAERPPRPPAEALAACKSSASGQACSFTTRQGAIAGSCWAPQGMALACRPNDAQPSPEGAAPSPKR